MSLCLFALFLHSVVTSLKFLFNFFLLDPRRKLLEPARALIVPEVDSTRETQHNYVKFPDSHHLWSSQQPSVLVFFVPISIFRIYFQVLI